MDDPADRGTQPLQLVDDGVVLSGLCLRGGGSVLSLGVLWLRGSTRSMRGLCLAGGSLSSLEEFCPRDDPVLALWPSGLESKALLASLLSQSTRGSEFNPSSSGIRRHSVRRYLL